MAVHNVAGWESLYSPRVCLHNNALRRFLCWDPAPDRLTKGNANNHREVPGSTGTMGNATMENGTATCVNGWLRFGAGLEGK